MDILCRDNLARKVVGFDLHPQEVDGCNVDVVYKAIIPAKSTKGALSYMVLNTVKGKGTTFAGPRCEHSS